jgi:hypothetical protein
VNLVITLASRGRPEQLLGTIRQSIVNWRSSSTRMIVQVDADDGETMRALNRASLPNAVTVNVQPREDTIAEKWNRAMSVPADVYLVAADDDPYITPGYDEKILQAAWKFPDSIGMVYGHPANASFSCMVAPTAKLVEKMGYIQPPLFPYWFVDHWTDDLARIIGRISFADVRTDQSRAGKTQEMREPGWWATFFDAAYLMRRKQAHDIINAKDFKSPAWLKHLLLAHHPMIEYRSRWINENVRRESKQLEGWSGLHTADDRYQRIRARAVAMVPHLLDDYGMDPAEAAMFRKVLTPPTEVVGLKRAFA